jgi:hypothetical protein
VIHNDTRSTKHKTKQYLWNLHGSLILMSRCNGVDVVSGLRCGQPGIRIRVGGRDFLSSRTSRLTPFNAEARNWCGATSTRPMRLLGVEKKKVYRFDCFQVSLLCGNEFPNSHFLGQNGINCNDFDIEFEKWNKTDNALCSNFCFN